MKSQFKSFNQEYTFRSIMSCALFLVIFFSYLFLPIYFYNFLSTAYILIVIALISCYLFNLYSGEREEDLKRYDHIEYKFYHSLHSVFYILFAMIIGDRFLAIVSAIHFLFSAIWLKLHEKECKHNNL